MGLKTRSAILRSLPGRRPAGTLYTIGPAGVSYAPSPPRPGGHMAKIKHIAISSQDPDKTAKFYVDVFGMKQVGRIDNPNTTGYYLTDGDLNLAILKFKND